MLKYAYLNSLVTIWQAKILTEDVLRSSKQSLSLTLKSFNYGDGKDSVFKMISRENELIQEKVYKYMPDKRVLEILFLEEKASRLKLIFKNTLFNLNLELTQNKEETLFVKFLNEKNVLVLPKPFQKLFKNFSFTDLEPIKVSTYIDQAFFTLALIKSKGYPKLKAWVKERIDLKNLFLERRLEFLNFKKDAIKDLFINGGNFSLNEYLINKKKFIKYISIFKKENSLETIEKQIDQYLIDYFKKVNLNPLGYEKICALFLAKKQEERTIRLLYEEEQNGKNETCDLFNS